MNQLRRPGLILSEACAWVVAAISAVSGILRAVGIRFWGVDWNSSPGVIRNLAYRLDHAPTWDHYSFPVTVDRDGALTELLIVETQRLGGIIPASPPVTVGASPGPTAFAQGWSQVWPSYVVLTVSHLVLIVGAVLVAMIIRAARAGQPFAPANARRVLALSWLSLAGATALPGARWLVETWLLSKSPWPEAIPAASGLDMVNWGLLAASGVLFALVAVWRRGIQLEQETEGLV